MPPKTIESSAKVFVLACIDPRYTARLEQYLVNDKELHGDYDLFALAGCELGAIKDLRWRKTLMEHIQLAIDLHGINKVFCFSHLDCGAYKAFLGLENDNDWKIHSKQLRKMKKTLERQFPKLGFRGYVMMENGDIKLVVKE